MLPRLPRIENCLPSSFQGNSAKCETHSIQARIRYRIHLQGNMLLFWAQKWNQDAKNREWWGLWVSGSNPLILSKLAFMLLDWTGAGSMRNKRLKKVLWRPVGILFNKLGGRVLQKFGRVESMEAGWCCAFIISHQEGGAACCFLYSSPNCCN